jgi:solute carrier family 35 (UDP-galactose transporter), member B1
MARTKQATPVRRNPSSEYISKEDRTPIRNLERALNGATNGHVNGSVLGSLVPKAQQKEAGALQFLVAVGGIYGSLYGPQTSPESYF